MTDTIHRFERAGLGRAPFRFLGITEKTYQACHGAPIQPGSSCDYCGQGIRYECQIESSDGQRFKVGCDCVRRVGDKGLVKIVDRKVREIERTKRHERDAAKIAALKAAMPLSRVRAARRLMQSTRHPNDWARSQGLTMWDAWTYAYRLCGTSGTIRYLKGLNKWADDAARQH